MTHLGMGAQQSQIRKVVYSRVVQTGHLAELARMVLVEFEFEMILR